MQTVLASIYPWLNLDMDLAQFCLNKKDFWTKSIPKMSQWLICPLFTLLLVLRRELLHSLPGPVEVSRLYILHQSSQSHD